MPENYINGKTRLCGLIGNPVEHTLSPLVHNTLAKEMGINLVYVPLLVKEDVESAVKGAYALNVLGMNVTVPYKTEVMKSLAECDELAEKIGAVNTLVRTQKGYKGYNTDISGLYRAIQSCGIVLQEETVVILGAGGAARAAAFMCAFHGVKKVYLLNRSVQKAQVLAREVNAAMRRECIFPMALEEYPMLPEEKMLCIQATSVGLSPKDGEAVIEDKAFYKKIHTGYDLIYQPINTRFMQLVKEQGGKAFHGLKLLLYQGVEAFELWNQVTIQETLADTIYEKLKGAMNIEE